MRFALLCGSALAVFAATSNAAVVAVNTTDHPLGGTSGITINIDILGLQTITISNIGISGGLNVDYLLDGTNTGTIESLGGALSLADVNQNFAGLFLIGSIQTIGVGADMTLGPESVVNRNFTVDSSTPGSLDLNSGTLQLTITGGALAGTITGLLGTNVVNVDLSTDPLSVAFSSLGTTTINGTADQDTTGLDPDGAELNLPLAFATTLDLSGVTLNVTTSGNLFLGSDVVVPEFGSIGLASLGVAGMGAAVAVRRRRRSA